MLFPKLMPSVGECSTQKRWYLWYRRVTQHRNPRGCSLNSLPNATNPSLSSYNSSPLHPLTARVQGEWVIVRFCEQVLCLLCLQQTTVSLQQAKSLLIFIAKCYVGAFSFGALNWGALGGDETPTPQEESVTSAAAPGSKDRPFCISIQLLQIFGNKTSIQLVFSTFSSLLFYILV